MRKIGPWVLAAVCVLLLVVLFNLFQPATRPAAPAVAYSDLLAQAANGDVASVVLRGHALTGTGRNGASFTAYLPDDPALARRLAGQGVRVAAVPDDADEAPLLRVALAWIPSLAFLLVWVLTLRRLSNEVRALRRAVEAGAVRSPGEGSIAPR